MLPLRKAVFKNIELNIKPKLKIEKHFVSEDIVNKYIQGRRFTKMRIKDNKIILSMFDGRKLIFIHTSKGYKIQIKLGKLYMTKRELSLYNEMVEQALKKAKRDVPDECKDCFTVATSTF